MAGSKGYYSYRGRTPKWKIFLGLLLVLVILAALFALALQQYVVYDESGRPHIELPWQEEAPKEPAPPEEELNITIEKAQRNEALRAVQIPAAPLTDWPAARQALPEGAYNAVALTVKDSAGTLHFRAPGAAPALGELLAEAEESYHVIARLACFLDPKAALADVEGKGLKNTGGFIFYDGNNHQWLDPGKPGARQYLCELAGELAALGFDEILLTDVGYPSQGKLDKIAYGETMKSENLKLFLTELREALEPYSVALSLELPAAVIAHGSDNVTGLLLADVAPLVDRIYAATTADQVETLAQAVTAVGAETAFVPELTALPEGFPPESGCLIVE